METTAMGLALDKGLKEKVERAAKTGGAIPKLLKPVMDLEHLKKAREQMVADTRSFLGQIGDIIADWVKFARNIYAMPADERSAYRAEIVHAENVILSYLGVDPGKEAAQDAKQNYEAACKNPLLTGAAKQAYALAMADTCPPRKQSVWDLVNGNPHHRLPGLVQLDLLEEVRGEAPKNATTVEIENPMRRGDIVTFKLNGKKEDAVKLANSIEKARENAVRTGRDFYREKVREIMAEATPEYTVEDLLAGKPGRIVLLVPDHVCVVPEYKEKHPGGPWIPTGNKEEKQHFGGTAEFEVKDKDQYGRQIKPAVFVIRAIGRFQRIMAEIADANVYVPVLALTQEQYSPSGDKDFKSRCRKLHDNLRWAIGTKKEQIKFHSGCDSEAAELERKQSFKAEKRLLNPALGPGTAMISLRVKDDEGREYEGSWTVDREKDTETRYPRVHFLAEWNADGWVRIAEYPERLNGLFGDRFAEFADPKENFEGLKHPLDAILRKAWAIAQADQDNRAQAAGQDEQRAEVEEMKVGGSPQAAHGWTEDAVRKQFGDAPVEEAAPADKK